MPFAKVFFLEMSTGRSVSVIATGAARFAHLSHSMGQYRYMQKSLTIVLQLFAGMMLLGNAPAQQTPAATTPQSTTSPTQPAAPAKTPSATATKKAPATTKSATA